jgi:acetyl esterase
MFVSVDPAVQQMLDLLAAAEQPDISELPVGDVRSNFDLLSSMSGGAGATDVRAEDRSIPRPPGEIPVRIYTPPSSGDEAPPLVVFFHGGGWVLGNLGTHDAVCRDLSSQSGAVLVAVDYRLAPEHVFPAAVDDAYAGLVWAHDHAAELGADPSRMAVIGDSAGGNLAAVTSVLARDRSGPALRLQVLAYPVIDGGLDTPSMKENAEGYFLTADAMRWFFDLYTGTDVDGPRTDPLVSVLRTADLSGLPPALVLTAEYDPLRDEGEEYARQLADAGVPTERTRYDGQIHGFLSFSAAVPACAEILTETALTLKAALA